MYLESHALKIFSSGHHDHYVSHSSTSFCGSNASKVSNLDVYEIIKGEQFSCFIFNEHIND